MLWCSTTSGAGPRYGPSTIPPPPRAARSSASRPPGCAAATGTAGWATTRTSGLPHVPGHELAGRDRGGRRPGRRTGGPATGSPCPSSAPAAAAPPARRGDQQVCERQTQPGFTHWGSFAEYVALEHADVNLVGAAATSCRSPPPPALGCRFATAFRAVVRQGRVRPGRVGRGARLRRGRAVRRDDRGGLRGAGRRGRRLRRGRWTWPGRFGAAVCVDAVGSHPGAVAEPSRS